MKIYLTHEQQIELLKSKGLTVSDEESALFHLRTEGYYNIINGYSEFFKYKCADDSKHYCRNATFEQILDLYKFDKNLRSIVYKYTSSIECYVKESIAHTFSKLHGTNNTVYLQSDCFSDSYPESVQRLIDECNKIIESSTQTNSNKYRDYIAHAKIKYDQVPLWILMRAMTFGQASKFYINMIESEREQIATLYNLTSQQMKTMLEILVTFRNIVAHGERTFCARLHRTRLPSHLSVLPKLSIPKNKTGDYLYGRNDFLSLLVCCKYFLPKLEFADLICEIDLLLDGLNKFLSDSLVGKIKIQMGFKNNCWKNLPKVDVL